MKSPQPQLSWTPHVRVRRASQPPLCALLNILTYKKWTDLLCTLGPQSVCMANKLEWFFFFFLQTTATWWLEAISFGDCACLPCRSRVQNNTIKYLLDSRPYMFPLEHHSKKPQCLRMWSELRRGWINEWLWIWLGKRKGRKRYFKLMFEIEWVC